MAVEKPTRRTIESRIHLRMQGRDVPFTDLTVISAVRILVREAIIEEIMSLWAGLEQTERDWYIQDAQGDALERRLADYTLSRRAAVAATGTVLIGVDANTTITSGMVVKTDPEHRATTPVRRYQVLPNPAVADGSWAISANSSARVRVQAVEVGVSGNTGANTITATEDVIASVVSITNEYPLDDGREAATDEEFRASFLEHLASLHRSTRGGIVAGIKKYEDDAGTRPVRSVALDEWDGAEPLSGNKALHVYIADSSGGADAGLIAAVQQLVDGTDTESDPGLRGAGVPTQVLGASPFFVDATVNVDLSTDANAETVRTAVEEAIRKHVADLPVGGRKISGEAQGTLVFAQLFRDVMDVSGVLRAQFDAPRGDISVPTGIKLVARGVTVHVVT